MMPALIKPMKVLSPSIAAQAELKWSQLSGSNRRPTVYKTVALPLS